MAKSEVEHISDNLYKVPLSLLRIANSDGDDKVLGFPFRNPRRGRMAGKLLSKGLEQEKIAQLAESIRQTKMQHPLIVGTAHKNIGSQQLTILSGERRYRALHSLVGDDVECFDPTTQKHVAASKLYAAVECRIYTGIDRKLAIKLAFDVNENAESIGEAADVAMVLELREQGFTDPEILDITGKSPTWLRDTGILGRLDQQTLMALAEEKINRTVALQLCKEKDEASRHALLAATVEAAENRILQIKQEAEKRYDAALDNHEMAKGNLAAAELTGEGQASAVAKMQQAERQMEKVEQDTRQTRNRKPTASTKDLQAAKARNGGAKPLTVNKIRKFWVGLAESLVIGQGKTDKGETPDIDLEDARLVVLLAKKGIDRGEKDLMKLLAEHNTSKANRKLAEHKA